MQELDTNPKVTHFDDSIIIDLCPGMSLRLSVIDSLKLLADLNRETQRAMQCMPVEPIEIDLVWDDEETTEVRR